MMLAKVTRIVPKLSRSSYRIASISRRTMAGLGEQLHKKEKVEEDRYMRAQEDEWKEKLRQLKAKEAIEQAEALHIEVVDPVKADIAAMLSQSGDKISDEGLETLAKWKLDL